MRELTLWDSKKSNGHNTIVMTLTSGVMPKLLTLAPLPWKMRLTYIFIAIPRILYAADVFLNPQRRMKKKRKDGKSSIRTVNCLASIQRKAAILITGAMHTTAADVLDIHANLLPMMGQVDVDEPRLPWQWQHQLKMRLDELT